MDNPLKHLYLENGFFWNDFLREFTAEYGGKSVKYFHHQTSDLMTAHFCLPSLIKVGRNYGQHQLTYAYLGEEIAPVGDCNNMHIELLLTEGGRLIDFADYKLLYWGSLKPGSWKESLQFLLEGNKPIELGNIE